MSKPRLIAFYLPQFHPTKENDEWWGKGFTEWTNVGNAKPLFPGHYQPRVPADLGYYDLRIPEVREQQAELAREAGIEGFCYWHYWFNGKRLLDRPFREVLESGKPDFPFCLCWANHSWYKKVWDPRKGKDKLLIEQTYPGEEDYIAHFYEMLPAFKDPRYMKVNGKPIFGFFIPFDNISNFVNTWNRLAKENGFDGFYFFQLTWGDVTWKNEDIHACLCQLRNLDFEGNFVSKFLWRVLKRLTDFPRTSSYEHYMKVFFQKWHEANRKSLQGSLCPCIVPNFDHSPRSKNLGAILTGSSPDKWKDFCIKVFKLVCNRPHEENIVFVRSWNEWGEGNYMEPDLKYGKKYIQATKEAMEATDET